MEKKTILVVKPNLKMHQVARQLGAYLRLEYITCENIKEAIGLLERVPVDLITAEAFMDTGGEDHVFGLIKAVQALPKQLQRPIWIFAAEPGPIGTQLFQQTAVFAQLLGAKRVFVAHFADVPRLVIETRAALDVTYGEKPRL
jgi:hypothetical protein